MRRTCKLGLDQWSQKAKHRAPTGTCLPKSPIKLVNSTKEVTFHRVQLRSVPSNGPSLTTAYPCPWQLSWQRICLQCRRPQFNSWIWKIPWRRDRLPTPVFGSAGKESACNAGDLGSIPWLGRSLGEGKGYPLQYSSLEKSMNSIVHGVAELDTTERLSLSSMYRAITSSLLLGRKCPPLA